MTTEKSASLLGEIGDADEKDDDSTSDTTATQDDIAGGPSSSSVQCVVRRREYGGENPLGRESDRKPVHYDADVDKEDTSTRKEERQGRTKDTSKAFYL